MMCKIKSCILNKEGKCWFNPITSWINVLNCPNVYVTGYRRDISIITKLETPECKLQIESISSGDATYHYCVGERNCILYTAYANSCKKFKLG